MKPNEKKDSDALYLDLFLSESASVTDAQIAYFREHPEQIDEVSAPLNIYRFFLGAGALLGVVLVAVAKFLKFSLLLGFVSEGVREFVVDILYESGVALISAVITAYILGILLKKHQENAVAWRAELRRKLDGQPPSK